MERKEFVEKYGFDLEKLERDCIDEILSKGFICYSVKELAYEICSRIYGALNVTNLDYFIYYKLEKIGNNYIHKIAFAYGDLVFIFDICWRNSVLVVNNYDWVTWEDFEKDIDWEDIECAIEDDEE